MAPKDAHAIVVKRKRLTLAPDVGIAIMLLAAVLQFFNPTVSTALWLGGGALAAVGILLLRKSIGGADMPRAELDEYETQRHIEARDEGLSWSIFSSTAMFVLTGFLALATRFGFEPSSLDVALFFAKLLFCQMLWIPFVVARSLAGKINRDALIAAE